MVAGAADVILYSMTTCNLWNIFNEYCKNSTMALKDDMLNFHQLQVGGTFYTHRAFIIPYFLVSGRTIYFPPCTTDVQCDLLSDSDPADFLWSNISFIMDKTKKGTKLHFKSLTAERRHMMCFGADGDLTHAARPRGAEYARLCELGWGDMDIILNKVTDNRISNQITGYRVINKIRTSDTFAISSWWCRMWFVLIRIECTPLVLYLFSFILVKKWSWSFQ